jgi:hypothetical protein
MDGINLTFSANIANLQRLGLDPTTSEGKAKLIGLLLRSIEWTLATTAPFRDHEEDILREFLADS